MLELTNTGDAAEDVELQLLGDGAARRPHEAPPPAGRAPAALLSASSPARAARSRRRSRSLDGTHDDLPADDHAYALLPERRRAKVLVVTRGQHVPRGGAAPRRVPRRDRRRARRVRRRRSRQGGWDAVIFDGVTPAGAAEGQRALPRPARPGLAGEGRATSSSSPGFDKVDRKHPVVRFLALDDVNIAAATSSCPRRGDKVVGASDGGASPILVAGTRGGYKFVALGLRRARQRSAAAHRVAALRPRLHQLVHRRGRAVPLELPDRRGLARSRWRRGVDGGDAEAPRRHARSRVPVHEGRAVSSASTPGSTSSTTPRPTARGPSAPSPRTCSTRRRAPSPRRTRSSSTARPPGSSTGFHVGVRREIWIYLLLAAALLTALEWATYHRRMTV